MNMANYIKFMRCVEAVKARKESGRPADFSRGEIDEKPKPQFYLTADTQKTQMIAENAKVFEIPEDIKQMLLLTDPPKDPELLRLPFPEIFLEVSISKYDGEFDEESDCIYGILVKETKTIGRPSNKEGRVFSIAYRTDETQKGKPYMFLDETVFNVDSSGLRFRYQLKPKISKTLKRFVFNFVLFLNQPEVRLVEEVHRTKEHWEKRISKGKIPLPPSKVVKVTGILRKYIDEIRPHIERRGVSHRFWVRGFWRHLRSPIYKKRQGTLVWIAPHIRGKGFLVNKSYITVKHPKEIYKKFETGD